MVRVAIYTRVSTSMQFEDGHSLESQKKVLTDYCHLKKWAVVNVYTDEGISAKNTNRPGFQNMLIDAAQHKFDVVLVWKLSRLSRSLKDLIVTVEELEKMKVTLVSYSESIDLSTAVGKLMFNIIGSFAEFERETISENVKLSFAQLAKKGARTFSHCYGYRVVEKELVVCEREAKAINLLYDYFLKSESISETQHYAASLGIRGRRGGKLTFNSTQVILRNVAYVGYSMYKGYIPYKQRIVPRIVNDNKFNEVQNLLKQKYPNFSSKGLVKNIDEWLSAEPPSKNFTTN